MNEIKGLPNIFNILSGTTLIISGIISSILSLNIRIKNIYDINSILHKYSLFYFSISIVLIGLYFVSKKYKFSKESIIILILSSLSPIFYFSGYNISIFGKFNTIFLSIIILLSIYSFLLSYSLYIERLNDNPDKSKSLSFSKSSKFLDGLQAIGLILLFVVFSLAAFVFLQVYSEETIHQPDRIIHYRFSATPDRFLPAAKFETNMLRRVLSSSGAALMLMFPLLFLFACISIPILAITNQVKKYFHLKKPIK